MSRTTGEAEALLCAEIRAEAQREADAVLRAAREQAECLQIDAASRAAIARQELLDTATEEAARRQAALAAGVAVEMGRRRAARLEALIQSIHDEVARRLRAHEGFDYHETVPALALDAMRRMSGDRFVVRLAAADRNEMGARFHTELEHRMGHRLDVTLETDPDAQADGVQILNDRGHHVWDNRLAPRLARLWPELRRQVAVAAGFAPTEGGT